MVLSLASLVAGKEIIHDVEITSLGETLKVRELPTKQLETIRDVFAKVDGVESERVAVEKLLVATLTDEENSVMSSEQVDMLLENAQPSVVKEIITKVFKVHQGAELGES